MKLKGREWRREENETKKKGLEKREGNGEGVRMKLKGREWRRVRMKLKGREWRRDENETKGKGMEKGLE